MATSQPKRGRLELDEVSEKRQEIQIQRLEAEVERSKQKAVDWHKDSPDELCEAEEGESGQEGSREHRGEILDVFHSRIERVVKKNTTFPTSLSSTRPASTWSQSAGSLAKEGFRQWYIHHSESHWSDAETMDRYTDKVLVPYVKTQREFFGLGPAALAILYVFKEHRCPALRQKIKDNSILAVFVPACCTGVLQPLDCD
ncbi:Hypp9556 [Branchiostoma lanceolatum]|uniref:Hypp9556 protein n=1 Tax=Branchiostoma lanceolatum TaxID=7740 RepID=A0A8S4MNF5_BRALA|nr:Hypp9556 [Branchiostoma lanceolatum]